MSKSVEMGSRLTSQHIGMGAGQFQPKHGHHRRFAGRLILPGSLANLCFVTLHVEKVVGDLERSTQITTIRRHHMSLLTRRSAEYCARFRTVLDQPAGLQRLQPCYRRSVEDLPLGKHVDHLAARHTSRSRRGPKRHHELAASLGIGMGIVFSQYLERTALQRVASQDRGRLVEGLMCACFATPQVVIIHRRQIIVH